MPVLEAVSTALLAGAPPATVLDARLSVAVYCPTTCDSTAILQLGQDLQQQLEVAAALPSKAAKSPTFVMAALTTDEFGRPDPEVLDSYGIGLGDAELGVLAGSAEVVVVEVATPRAGALATNLALNEHMGAFAASQGGVLEDLESRELFSQAAWQTQRVDAARSGRLQDLFRVEVYGDGDWERLSTHGLVKLGLHELVIDDVFVDFADDLAASTVLMAAYAMDHGPWTGGAVSLDVGAIRNAPTKQWLEGFVCTTEAPGTQQAGTGRATVAFTAADAREHDGDAAIAKPVFGDASVADPAERMGQFLDELWGYGCRGTDAEATVADASPPTASDAALAVPVGPAGDPTEVATTPPPPTLEAAQAQAQAAFHGSVKSRWQDGALPAGTRLMVKGPFRGPKDAVEWMWVEVAVWDAELLQGELLNEPNDIPDRHAGDAVVVDESEVYDYLLRFPDGTEEGALTEGLVQR